MVVESHQMGALLTGVEKMAYLINRCTIYELLYLNKQLPKEVELKPAVTNLEAKLVALYTIMLDFLINASRTFNKRTGERTLNAVFNPGKLTIFLNECQALENDLGHEVQNCESVYVRGVEIKSDEQMEKLRRLLEAPILRVDSGVATICQKLESSERLSILQWISSIQYIENHSFLRQGRTIGTGEWLLKHQRYRTWQNSSASGILWLHGDREYPLTFL